MRCKPKSNSQQGISALFESQVLRTPNAIALSFREQALTYSELDRRANQCAHYLRKLQVGPEVRVGACLERGPSMIVVLLGILKAGGTYVPLDPEFPSERLAYMVDDTSAAVVVTQTKFRALLPKSVFTVDVEADAERIAAESDRIPTELAEPKNGAYVVYTSGSTGRPKGVVIERGNMTNMVLAQHEAFEIRETDRVLQFFSFGFDVSVFAIFMALSSGARLVVGTREDLMPGPELQGVLEQEEITIGILPPIVLNHLSSSRLPKLRQVIVGGEAWREELLETWGQGRKFFNSYGPTETTVQVAVGECHAGEGKPSIGRPIVNAQIYLLDEEGQPVPVGAVGELYIGGEGVGRGYLDASLTAEKYVPDGFSGEPGKRLYRTGDWGRWLPDGRIDLVGRRDEQIKIRGYRVELSEIEAVLMEHPAIREAVVTVRQDKAGEKRLVAYYVMESGYRSRDSCEALKAEQLSGWALATDVVARGWDSVEDVTFNIAGWNSSYTGQAIPAEEIREWLERTVERIVALQPKRVWEIGCGTGLLLFRIAPGCTFYQCTDASAVAINFLRQQLQRPEFQMPQVALECKAAHELDANGSGARFDVVVLNSLVQFFPDIQYLKTILTSVMEALRPGGAVFIGDVRSYPWLESFHTSVALHQAPDSATCDDLWKGVQHRMRLESELVIHPGFFTTLPRWLPQISRVEVHLKRGRARNELTRFRYDVVLHVGEPAAQVECEWLDWKRESLNLSTVSQRLGQEQPEVLGIQSVPNPRLQGDAAAARILNDGLRPATVRDLRAQLEMQRGSTFELEELWELGQELGYEAEVRPSQSAISDCDVVFRRRPEHGKAVRQAVVRFPGEREARGSLETYATDPVQQMMAESLARELRSYLTRKLPAYMVPAAYVRIERIPLTVSGKVDRRAMAGLEEKEYARRAYAAPVGEMEEALADIWVKLLQVERVGRHDNFFELGGHSLHAARVVSRIRQGLGVAVGIGDLFARPVLADLADSLKSAGSAKLPPIKRAKRTERLPLSFEQQRLWFIAQMEGGSKAYHMPFGLQLRGALDVAALRKALDRIVARHEALRTTFVVAEGEPAQKIASAADSRFHLVESDLSQHDNAPALLERMVAEEANTAFDLEEGPLIRGRLIREGKKQHTFLINMHHIVSDGWSIGVFFNELSQLYTAFRRGEEDPLPELVVQYADYAVWEWEWIDKEVLREQGDYWKRTLEGAPRLLELPTDRERPLRQDYEGGFEHLVLEEGLTARLKELSWRHGTTLYMTLLAGWSALLARLSGQAEVVVGTPVANRGRTEIEGLIGFFVNTLALRVEMGTRTTVAELLQQVKEVALGAQQNQNVPFERVVEMVRPERTLRYSPLFQTMLSWENTPEGTLMLPGVETKPLASTFYQPAMFDLTLSLQEVGQGMVGGLEYAKALFDPGTIRRYAGYLVRLLEGMAGDERRVVEWLPLVSEEERQRVVYEWNETGREYPSEKCVHELFEEQVERTPEAVAVEYDEQQVTYRELNRRSNQLAHYLRDLGVKPDMRVAICTEKGLEMIVALLAILKAGGAYVPLDPKYPMERLHYMFRDSAPAALLTQAHLKDRFAGLPAGMRLVDVADSDAWRDQSESNPKTASAGVTSGNLAYIIYTSGSTGNPKGVMIAHRGVCNLITALQAQWRTCEQDRLLQFASITFDVSVEEIFCALFSGAALVLRSDALQAGTREFWSLLGSSGITVVDIPTRFWSQIVEDQATPIPRNVRLVVIGGEAVEKNAVARWFEQKGHRPTLWNMYGPTETTVNATMRELTLDPSSWASIGKPIANTQVYILDGHLEPVPVGVVGEVYVGGADLARGYINRSELTAERFVPDPYIMSPGGRMYKTGDVGRLRDDGNIEFLGRNDDQVKIRGYRIEPGEIEARLRQHKAVNAAVVVAREDRPGQKELVGYVVPAPGHRVDGAELRRFVRERLPEHMVPAAIVEIKNLPLTTNGKLDKRRLPTPELLQVSSQFVAPQNSVQKAIAEIWEKTLGKPNLGIYDDFTEVGGHSLVGMRICARIRSLFEINFTVANLYESPTIAGIADFISKTLIEGSDTNQIDDVMLPL